MSHNQSGSDFQAGTRLRLTASPQANYKFVHWVQGETVVSTQTSFYYTMPAEAVTLQAVFEFYPGAYGGDMNPSDPSQPGISVKSYKLTASAVESALCGPQSGRPLSPVFPRSHMQLRVQNSEGGLVGSGSSCCPPSSLALQTPIT